jgi:hypothetical protein
MSRPFDRLAANAELRRELQPRGGQRKEQQAQRAGRWGVEREDRREAQQDRRVARHAALPERNCRRNHGRDPTERAQRIDAERKRRNQADYS